VSVEIGIGLAPSFRDQVDYIFLWASTFATTTSLNAERTKIDLFYCMIEREVRSIKGEKKETSGCNWARYLNLKKGVLQSYVYVRHLYCVIDNVVDFFSC